MMFANFLWSWFHRGAYSWSAYSWSVRLAFNEWLYWRTMRRILLRR